MDGIPPCLVNWIHCMYEGLFPNDTFARTENSVDAFKRILSKTGARIFELNAEKESITNLIHAINDYFSENFEESEWNLIAEYCYVFALSANCKERTFCIETITKMDLPSQSELQQIYEDNMKLTPAERESFHSNFPILNEVSEELRNEVIAQSVKIDQQSSIIASLNEKLNQDNARHSYQISELEEQIKRKNDEIFEKNECIRMTEVSNNELETEIAAMKKANHDLESKIFDLKETNEKLLDENAVLLDELGLLRDKSTKLDALQTSFNRYRTLPEELQSMKNKLIEEETGHNATYSKMVEYEVELKELKTALEVSKQTHRELEKRLVEFQEKVAEREKVVVQMAEEMEGVRCRERSANQQIGQLKMDLDIMNGLQDGKESKEKSLRNIVSTTGAVRKVEGGRHLIEPTANIMHQNQYDSLEISDLRQQLEDAHRRILELERLLQLSSKALAKDPTPEQQTKTCWEYFFAAN